MSQNGGFMVRLEDGSIKISDGVSTYVLPAKSLKEFKHVGLTKLDAQSGAERTFKVIETNVSGSFDRPDPEDIVVIHLLQYPHEPGIPKPLNPIYTPKKHLN